MMLQVVKKKEKNQKPNVKNIQKNVKLRKENPLKNKLYYFSNIII